MIESLVVVPIGQQVWIVDVIHLLVELVTEYLVVAGAGLDVWVV